MNTAVDPALDAAVPLERLRSLSITWRWWAATQCRADRVERITWIQAARELEQAVGLPAPSEQVVMAPNSTPTHRCPRCGNPYWYDGAAPMCVGRVDLDAHGARTEHEPTQTVEGADLAPWSTWEVAG